MECVPSTTTWMLGLGSWDGFNHGNLVGRRNKRTCEVRTYRFVLGILVGSGVFFELFQLGTSQLFG